MRLCTAQTLLQLLDFWPDGVICHDQEESAIEEQPAADAAAAEAAAVAAAAEATEAEAAAAEAEGARSREVQRQLAEEAERRRR